MILFTALAALSQIIFSLFILVGLVALILSPFDKSDDKPKYKQRWYTIDGVPTLISERDDTKSTPTVTGEGIYSSDQKDAYWGLVSFAYQKLKQTPVYKKWRHEQFDCQFGKCGICGKPMDRDYTQLDHIKARYDCGTNYSDNLVLVHPKCNENKGANTGTLPSWVKENPYSKEFDKKAWEILQAVRKEYPDKVLDSMISLPKSIKPSSKFNTKEGE